MANLNCIINSIFDGSYRYSAIRKLYRYNAPIETDSPVTSTKFMDIPINTNSFELPLFMYWACANVLTGDTIPDVISAKLVSYGLKSDYKTTESIMKDALSTSFEYKLIQVNVSNTSYYVTYGALFDKDFKPLMMLLWNMNNISTDDTPRYSLEPICRVDPVLYVDKKDAIQKFIAGKFITTVLQSYAHVPRQALPIIYSDSNYITPKVEIAPLRFNIRSVSTPSISTDNEALLQLAIDNVEELMQCNCY
jgi:hypothetical protein